MNEKVLSAIKESLGELEVGVIESLIKDNERIPGLESQVSDLERRLALKSESSEEYYRQLQDTSSEKDKLNADLIDARQQILEGAKDIMKAQLSETISNERREDKNRLMDILAGSYRQYVQTTTTQKQLPVGGGSYHTGSYDNQNNPIMADGAEALMDTTEKR